MSIIQQQFITSVLRDEAARLKKNQGLAMKKLLHFRTGELFNNRETTITPEGTMGGRLTFRHTAHQRFLDMKRKVRNKRSGRIGNKSYPIHNKYVMGHYSSIGYRLMYDLTQDVVEGIKRDLKVSNNG